MLAEYLKVVEKQNFVRRMGRIKRSYGLVLESSGPDVYLGERCEIYCHSDKDPIPAEVVGIREDKVQLMPFGDVRGIRIGSEVVATGESLQVPIGKNLLGRVIDAFGNPLDDKAPIEYEDVYPLYAEPINPLHRPRIETVLETGVRILDTMLTLGRGQRVGIFSGSGVGKSTLLGMIARHMNADVNVIALIGERGREVLEFVEETLGPEGLARSVVVVATSDQPALVRTHAAYAATAIAEYFRDMGKHVLLTMDSVTRFAMAQREIGLAVGEPPTSRGYTPSVFSTLPKLLERGGTHHHGGSITSLYTVLVEGDDLNDPISDNVRAILDGHIVLSRELANYGQYPSVDLLHSNSRLMHSLLNDNELALSRRVLKLMSMYNRSKDMIDIGVYKAGSNPELDEAVQRVPKINHLFSQTINDHTHINDTFLRLQGVMG